MYVLLYTKGFQVMTNVCTIEHEWISGIDKRMFFVYEGIPGNDKRMFYCT